MTVVLNDAQTTTAKGCPIDHSKYSRKTMPAPAELPAVPLEKDKDGVWHIYDYDLVKKILRSPSVRQAGFSAEVFLEVPQLTRAPILFLEGKAHAEQRKQSALFFTPKRTQQYRDLMINYADQTIEDFKRKGRADLSVMTMEMAVLVASQIVGLKSDDIPGLSRRITRLMNSSIPEIGYSPILLFKFVLAQVHMLNFLYRDVKPSIREKRKNPDYDVITHVIECGYSDLEILIECVTYGAAGMATTREFISVCFLHMMENEALKNRYLEADEEERYQILNEILRLEPVVSNLHRRATEDFSIEVGDETVTIAAGELIDLSIIDANVDEDAVGESPFELCPGRDLAKRVPEPVMSFGDGNHRCPGAYVAIQETDIFLKKLLSVEGIRIESDPDIYRNEMIKSYEIRNFMIAV